MFMQLIFSFCISGLNIVDLFTMKFYIKDMLLTLNTYSRITLKQEASK